MKVEELMIGDWVECEDGGIWRPSKVAQIMGFYPSIVISCGYGYQPENVRPLPLTKEILEKNFPKKDSEADYVKERMESGFSVNWFPISDLDVVFFLILDMPYKLDSARIEHIHKGTFKYVHEVQHLLRLCGIDKEISL